MALDISSFSKPIAILDLSSGRLFLYGMREQDLIALSRLPKSAAPRQKVLTSISCLSSRMDYDKETQPKPTRLSQAEIEGLPEEDVSQIAKAMLEPSYFNRLWSVSRDALRHRPPDVPTEPYDARIAVIVDWLVAERVKQAEKQKKLLGRSSFAALGNINMSALAEAKRNLDAQEELRRTLGIIDIGAIADTKRFLEENSASVTIATHLNREQDLMRAATSPLQNAQRYLEESSVSAMLARDIYRNEDLIWDAARALAQRESMSAAIAAGLGEQLKETRDLLKSHEAMFRLPEALEATRLLDSYQVGAIAEFAQRHTKDIFDRQRSLEAITTPWLHRLESARSVTAILELQEMGNALRTIKGFDPGLTAALRFDFGDWRDKITFPESVFIDPVARTDFYVNRGFNTALTDFPEAAFRQSLELAGLDGETVEIEIYGPVVRPSTDPEVEDGLRRTNKCHDRLQRFERRLRQFIDDAMTTQYGPDWPRKRLAPKLYEQWEFKKQQAESNGVNLTFIEVADFTDYETIICKQDHWREIFETRFKKKASVRESLQRLQPIRIATMHARIVTKEDELYLVAEVVRLFSAIK